MLILLGPANCGKTKLLQEVEPYCGAETMPRITRRDKQTAAATLKRKQEVAVSEESPNLQRPPDESTRLRGAMRSYCFPGGIQYAMQRLGI
ncbi:hypothetical protein Ndes2526B_g04981 [Nannochloris sp. 'desiccata']